MRQSLRALDPEVVRAAMFFELQESVTDDDAAVLGLSGTPIMTNRPIVEFVGASSVPSMRPWVGKRSQTAIVGDKSTVKATPWESGIYVTREDKLYNSLSMVERRIDDLTGVVGRHWAEALLDVIRNGTSTAVQYPKAYDGKPLFATGRKTGKSGTQQNTVSQVAATPTEPTVEEFIAALWSTIQAMKVLKDDQGRTMNGMVRDFVLVYPVPFMKAVAGALNAPQVLEGGQAVTNTIVQGSGMRFNAVCDPESEWTDKFAVFAGDGRALVRVETEDSLVVESDYDYATGRDDHGASVDRGIGVLRWQSAMLTTFAAA